MEKQKFEIAVKRSSVETFTVEAATQEEANRMALDEACNTDWAGKQADYEIVDNNL